MEQINLHLKLIVTFLFNLILLITVGTYILQCTQLTVDSLQFRTYLEYRIK